MKKTLKEKIENLAFYDLIAKLKDILSGISDKLDILSKKESSSGGSSQNLQQTLDNGNYAEVDGGNSYVHFLAGDSSNRYTILRVENDVEGSDITMTTEQIILSNSEESGLSARIEASNGLIAFRQSDFINNKTSLVRFATPILNNDESVIYEIPAKPAQYEVDGVTSIPYKLATEDQITLQKIIDNNGGGAMSSDNGNFEVRLITGTGVDREISFFATNPEQGTYIQMQENKLYLFQDSVNSGIAGGKASEIIIENGVLTINTSREGLYTTSLIFEDPISDSTLKIPAHTSGTRTLATIEDIIAIINMAGEHIPTYADNAAAITGGLAVNAAYKTASGEIRVRV